jgi:hypothetical protein
LTPLYDDLVCGYGTSDGCAGVNSILENGLLRTEKEGVPCLRAILLAVAANLGEVRVGGDDTWVLFDGVCNIFFCLMDAFAVARGTLLIFLGAIFNFIFGWMGALAFGRGVEIFFLGRGTETLGTIVRAHWALPLEVPLSSSSSSSSPSSSQTLLLFCPIT